MSLPSSTDPPPELRAPPQAVRALSPTQVVAVDDDRSLAAHTQWIEGTQGERLGQSRLLLSGLHCAACAGLIEEALGHVEVRIAEVNGAAQRAVVTWDPARTRMSVLIAAVRRRLRRLPRTPACRGGGGPTSRVRRCGGFFVAAFCTTR
ncbi:MAG: cation transporter [Burkholderiales bacterium]|nr:cation transporter [Burkholderiales bacterium]